ncbi:coproporphyrinogen dehydrogenase HemZ [Irregularibacter muris]|uniref:Coproporphyrinogen dehydrogenase HemZ n=1 Tax=Irregularibacter muris TaxID=1796619 RepID=A0AAE3L3G1_9FIRM|nr:coproporphyrinogen dehydrogenase HemZ [Irregularibacter muris]MCR1898203.1 coproporphyrinogen dehydrogenase HemZ [Irregularibacter muris]
MNLVILEGHDYQFDIREMLMQYFPRKNIIFQGESREDTYDYETVITNGLSIRKDEYIFYTVIKKNQQLISKYEIQLPSPLPLTHNEVIKLVKRKLKITIYKAMEKAFNNSLPWGILTGIRPTKIVHQLLNMGKMKKEIIEYLESEYLLHHKKIDLLLKIALNERNIIYPGDKNKISIYIGIPFCPSRCIYCSFISSTIGEKRDLLEKYLQALHHEIVQIGKYINNHKLNVESIYIGGGTPTVLNAEELKHLLFTIKSNINVEGIIEYTLEAGRPDTIDREKLQIAYQYGINRISINPQSMNDDTLHLIGRNHSSEDILRAYNLACETGFQCMNMDLILGLPNESVNEVKNTLAKIKDLRPENLTIHTMAVKKGSRLKDKLQDVDLSKEEEINKMLEATEEFARLNGYQPYYLYRQKYMMGNLENVGYCTADNKGIYNIQMMAEKQTIIGLGAGSVTKVIYLEEDRLERVPNVKNVEQYIQRVDELVNKKIVMLNDLYET